ncbi:unnamed protein product [Ambrosiozyma monospora]|uniref:Unnamed protein product n=1 Tax=Ambrosiozyma monospora TaxID=43982 RepID=A0ACB5TAB0_AMBMO|nr:unnamed protein product [Ambrosiozyma monospora]
MSDDQPKCPVDHATREAWIQKAKQVNSSPSYQHQIREQHQLQQSLQQPTQQSNWKSTLSSLFWAPATPNNTVTSSRTISQPNQQQQQPHPVQTQNESSVCPVDHDARAKWMSLGMSKPDLTPKKRDFVYTTYRIRRKLDLSISEAIFQRYEEKRLES